jgi:hypothetical protein
MQVPSLGSRVTLASSVMKNRHIYKQIAFPAILLISFLWLSVDGHHYWHEIRFLYGTSQFSMEGLLAGRFNPHQLGGEIDERSASGFYSAKALHLVLVKGLFTLVPAADGGFKLGILISLLIGGVTAAIGWEALRRLCGNKVAPLFLGICLTMMPVVPYLSGKLMSEVLALFWLTLSILLILLATRRDWPYPLSAFTCAAFLVLCALSRTDMVLGFLGFYVACLTYPTVVPRSKLIKLGTPIAILFGVGYLTVLWIWTPGPAVLYRYFTKYVLLESKSIPMSILGIATFGGLIYLAILMSFLSKQTRLVRFFGLWLLLTMIPMIFITLNYMVEPRYLASGTLPAAGLGAIGLQEVWSRYGFKSESAQTIILITLLTVVNKGVILLMPYELDAKAITLATSNILSKNRRAAILIPWSYTDYHFLKIMMPEAQLFNVDGLAHNLPAWRARMIQWYGESYIDDEEAVMRLLKNQPVYYLGWRKYPPAQNMKELADALNLQKLSLLIGSIPLKDHLADNWLWRSSRFYFEHSGNSGQYHYFRVRDNEGLVRGTTVEEGRLSGLSQPVRSMARDASLAASEAPE